MCRKGATDERGRGKEMEGKHDTCERNVKEKEEKRRKIKIKSKYLENEKENERGKILSESRIYSFLFRVANSQHKIILFTYSK